MIDITISRIQHRVCSERRYWLLVVVVGSGGGGGGSAAPFSSLSRSLLSPSDLPRKPSTSLICLQSVSLYHVAERGMSHQCFDSRATAAAMFN